MDVVISASLTLRGMARMTSMSWVLVVFMFNPGGDFLGKTGIPMQDRASCKIAAADVSRVKDPMAVQLKTMCVTRGHWDGTKPMKNVPLD